VRAAAVVSILVIAPILLGITSAAAQTPSAPTIHISRAAGPITIDGDLSDPGWRGATRVDQWFETYPGDNIAPPVKNVAYLTYDDRFFYVGFIFSDPNPKEILAPIADHDHVNSNNTDFGGIMIDALNSGRTAIEFFVTPSNVQYDAVQDDGSGENSAPDFFWNSATKIGPAGWTLEIAIPFSSLRYRTVDPETWGITLWRNYPHGFRYQFSSAPSPRASNCFVCHENRLLGLSGLPGGRHLVVAPYVSGFDTAKTQDDTAGEPLGGSHLSPRAGLDLKFTPDANNAIDATIKPDFSQVESDTPQISANERFALFYPEKRPFFLEGADLLSTPIQAVYTRTITAPDWGGRLTGKSAGIRYTALAVDDTGGGTAVIPGANSSSTVDEDFSSTIFVGRAKREIGQSFVGALVADREAGAVGGHNRVLGPDFQWRLSPEDVVTGQWLLSETVTPNLPTLADEWTGEHLSGNDLQANWSHNQTHLDWFAQYQNVAPGFRAETGFVPQVGYRDADGNVGWTVRPSGFIARERTYLQVINQADSSGAPLTEHIEPGINLDTRLSGFMQFRYIDERTRAGGLLIRRRQFGYFAQISPSRIFKYFEADGTLGGDIDFDNARPARGTTLNMQAVVQPTNHLEVALNEDLRSLNIRTPAGTLTRLLTQHVSQVNGTYNFTARLFFRLIAQYIDTTRDPAWYTSSVDARDSSFALSTLLAYKVNWQSVLFVGYGDDAGLAPDGRLAPLDRQFFVKLSHAFQR
jgi:hypothetical protein